MFRIRLQQWTTQRVPNELDVDWAVAWTARRCRQRAGLNLGRALTFSRTEKRATARTSIANFFFEIELIRVIFLLSTRGLAGGVPVSAMPFKKGCIVAPGIRASFSAQQR